ncbi:STAS domain-containing protein [Streptomyces sp. NPDC002580]|uniref:STAS domain-containing protein n=1 Tax=Streptomyces sp. NPDC002580 TaxID=3364653 RepID=UPI003674B564
MNLVTAAGVNLDLSAVPFSDCSGLDVLLRARHHAEAQGKTLALQATSPSAETLLMPTDTRHLFGDARAPGGRPRDHARPGAPCRALDGTGNTAPTPDTELEQLRRAMATRRPSISRAVS